MGTQILAESAPTEAVARKPRRTGWGGMFAVVLVGVELAWLAFLAFVAYTIAT